MKKTIDFFYWENEFFNRFEKKTLFLLNKQFFWYKHILKRYFQLLNSKIFNLMQSI